MNGELPHKSMASLSLGLVNTNSLVMLNSLNSPQTMCRLTHLGQQSNYFGSYAIIGSVLDRTVGLNRATVAYTELHNYALIYVAYTANIIVSVQ